MQAIWSDVRLAVRMLTRAPGFATAAILTLALGIGANAAVFSVVHAVLLEPLPYAEVDRRVQIWSRWRSFEKTWVSSAEVLDYRTRTSSLKDVAAWGVTRANLTGDGDPVRIGVARVTPNTFDVLGARPLAGAGFAEEDARPGSTATIAVISYGLWQRRYGGDSDVIGRTLLLDGKPRQIVGVMPRGFRLPTDYGEDAAEPTELWLSFELDRDPDDRGNHGLYAAAELAPGATAAQATAELATLTAALTAEGLYPVDMQFSAFAVPLDEEILGAVRPAVLLLFGAVVFLLLIACANVANLLLVRAEVRQREMAVRRALGAGARRLVRQVLTESFLLAAAAAVVGVGLAASAMRLLAGIGPAGIPRLDLAAVDLRVLLFAAGLAVATTVLFGLAPAVRALRLDLSTPLREGGRRMTSGANRFRGGLVVAELALSIVLLVGAGLMVRSLWLLQRIDVGFDPQNVLTLQLALPPEGYGDVERVTGFYAELADRVRAMPGVSHAGFMRLLPLGSSIGDYGLDVDGFEEAPGRNAKGDWQIATAGALEALGARLVRGRLISPMDTAMGQPVVVINETMAKTYWAGREALGGRIRLGSNPKRPWMMVVGIIADLHHNGMTAIVKEQFFVPHSQWHLSTGSPYRSMALLARSDGDPLNLAGPIRAAVGEMDPSLPIANLRPMQAVVDASIATPRLAGLLLGLFAALAVALAGVGVYGVLAYVVGQRTQEIGIRMAMGADPGRIMLMVLAGGFRLSLAGIGLGVAAAVLLTRLMEGLLYGVAPLDPVVFGAMTLALAAVALAASILPAWRATRVDPQVALRAE